MRLESSYQDGTNSLVVKAVGALGAPLFLPPALNIALTRKLFRRGNKQASVDLHVGRQPHVKLRLTAPTPFGLKLPNARHNDEEGPAVTSASLSGLESGITFASYGLDLEQGDPKLVGEFGVNFLELGTTLKTGLTLGFTGVNWILSALWSMPSNSTEISTTTTLGGAGVVLVLEYVVTLHKYQKYQADRCLQSGPLRAAAHAAYYSIHRVQWPPGILYDRLTCRRRPSRL